MAYTENMQYFNWQKTNDLEVKWEPSLFEWKRKKGNSVGFFKLKLVPGICGGGKLLKGKGLTVV